MYNSIKHVSESLEMENNLSAVVIHGCDDISNTYMCVKDGLKSIKLYLILWDGNGIMVGGMWYECMTLSRDQSQIIDINEIF